MTTPAAVHNAVGLLVDLYGGLLKAQADEIALLRQQVDLLTAALKRVSIPTGHDHQNEGGVPSPVGGGEELIRRQPVTTGRARAAEGGRVAQESPEVGQVEGRVNAWPPEDLKVSIGR